MKADLIRVRHMVDAATEIIEFSSGKERKDLESNRMLCLSLIHLLEIIGEAASGLSPEFRQKHNKIPWKAIIDMRNRLIHGYFDIDLDIVWSTVKEDIPPFLKQIKEVLEKEKNR